QRIPRPPAFVTIPTERPSSRPPDDNSEATATSSSSGYTRITPACRKSAPAAASEPARAAVCDLAARWPLCERPLLRARIGLRRAPPPGAAAATRRVLHHTDT